MRALAEEQALAAGVANVAFAAGSAGDLPCDDGSADVVVCITTDFWPPETVVPAFAREADRVLRPGGVALVLATPPGWYGGELHRLVSGDQAYEETLDALLREAGFDRLDFETVQDYGTPEHAVATYGFIFGSAASRRLRERRQSRISWRWRLHHRRR
jgi:SAM-dependent methyltransferase